MRRILLPHHISDEPAPAGATLRAYGGLSMGTSWSVLLAAGATATAPDLQAQLQRQLDAVVAEMSHWEAGSDLGRYNRAPRGTWLTLPPAFFDVLAFAIGVGRDSGGACDPCAGAIVNAWGFGPGGRHDQPGFTAPTAARIAELRAERVAQHVLLDAPGRRVLQPGGVQLDLSAVAKGYSVDRLAHFLMSQGLRHFLVEVGGELRGAGMKPDGQPWWVALEQPAAADAGPLAGDAAAVSQGGTAAGQAPGACSAAPAPLGEIALALHGLAVATSGDYRRYFLHGTQRYPHTIDPRSAAPIANRLASVTVVHPQCMAADAWSTALTVLGHEAGLALAERRGLAARFVVRNADDAGFTEYLSSPMRGMLSDDQD
ncbi:FAD:protein FMN transferase [Pseudoduganella sp. LjRoot289]|uniref:FAD:protein FMN transferase n=1 Tax=Pseudoduganella sp. LjRoot289 TaxID=3342314 RepID=UPI003ECEE7F7